MSTQLEQSAQLHGQQAIDYMLAGNATVTLRNAETGNRFTYRVRTPEDAHPDRPIFFVAVLTGDDNEGDYQYLGFIGTGARFNFGRKSRISPEAQCARVFAHVWPRLLAGTLDSRVEIWHEGRCGRCNRKLTDPESIAAGLGPICRGKSAE